MHNELRNLWNVARYPLQREWGNRRYPSGHLIWSAKLRAMARDHMGQNKWDMGRRGAFGGFDRLGENNRRFRKWKATQPKIIYSCIAFDLVA